MFFLTVAPPITRYKRVWDGDKQLPRWRNVLELLRRLPLLSQKSLWGALHHNLWEVSKHHHPPFSFISPLSSADSLTAIPVIDVCLQSLHLPVSDWVSGSPTVNRLQIHEHPGGPAGASGHLPDPSYQHVPQYAQHLQDQGWEWSRGIFPSGMCNGNCFFFVLLKKLEGG